MRIVVCAALVVLTLAVAVPDAAASSGCRLAGTRVWEQNNVARLLVGTTGGRPSALYGCLRAHEHARRLTKRVVGVRPGEGKGPVLAGGWALYEALDRRRATRADRPARSLNVEEMLATLPADQADAIRARVLDDESYREMAARLRCSPLVARKRVSRGLATLREIVTEEFP